MKINTLKVIELYDWDRCVMDTYGRTYKFQQQDGCKNRGLFKFSVPDETEDFENDIVPEVVNHEDMGVSFSAWLARDPKTLLIGKDSQDSFSLDLWWARNFYPEFQMVANDLYARGLLEAGEYAINIDW